jgi:dTMP kinase
MVESDISPLVTFEGIDRAGKSIVIDKVADTYDDIVQTAEPDETNPAGQLVRRELGVDASGAPPLSMLHLFLADHYWHVGETVRPAQADPTVTAVFSDRYIDSRYAYQPTAIRDFIDGDAMKFIQYVQETPMSSVTPDVTFFIDITVEESLRRGAESDEPDELFEYREFLDHARAAYHELLNYYPDRIVRIDGMQSSDEQENVAAMVADCQRELDARFDF